MTIEQYFHLMSSMESRLERIESRIEQHFSKEVEPDEDLQSVDEIAEYLGISGQTVRIYCKKGIIPFYKVGRSYFFKKHEVEKALRRKR